MASASIKIVLDCNASIETKRNINASNVTKCSQQDEGMPFWKENEQISEKPLVIAWQSLLGNDPAQNTTNKDSASSRVFWIFWTIHDVSCIQSEVWWEKFVGVRTFLKFPVVYSLPCIKSYCDSAWVLDCHEGTRPKEEEENIRSVKAYMM